MRNNRIFLGGWFLVLTVLLQRARHTFKKEELMDKTITFRKRGQTVHN